ALQTNRKELNFYGLFEERVLRELHDDFVRVDEKLQVEAMDLEGISERLIRLGIVETTRAANTTAFYAIQWMTGQTFDLSKTQVQTHRARLRQIGIDIAHKCDISRFSPVYVVRAA